MAVREYVGARYVPLFADPIQWSNQNTYEPLTIVVNQGASYTSRQFVPVGIDISNTEYWALTGNYDAQVEQYRQEVQAIAGNVQEIEKFEPSWAVPITKYGAISGQDSTDAIMAALADSNYVFIPEGIFTVSRQIVFPPNANIFGVGTGSVIKASPSFSGASVFQCAEHSHFVFKDFQIDLNNVAVRGIVAGAAYDNCLIQNMFFNNSVAACLYIGNQTESTISQSCAVSNCICYTSGTTDTTEEIMIFRYHYELNMTGNKLLNRANGLHSKNFCLKLDNCYDAYLSGNSFASSKLGGISVVGNSRYCRFIGNTYENLMDGETSKPIISMIGDSTDSIQYPIVIETPYYNTSKDIPCTNVVGAMGIGVTFNGGRRCTAINNRGTGSNATGNAILEFDGRATYTGTLGVKSPYDNVNDISTILSTDVSDSVNNGFKIYAAYNGVSTLLLTLLADRFMIPQNRIYMPGTDGKNYVISVNNGQLVVAEV